MKAARQHEVRMAKERDRQAAQQARQAARDQAAERIRQREQEAQDRTRQVSEQIAALDRVLLDGIRRAPFTFEHLFTRPRPVAFDPGPDGVPQRRPTWEQFEVAPPQGLGALFAKARYEREVQAARQSFDNAVHAYAAAERLRLQRLRDRQAEHQAQQDRTSQAARRHNADVEQRRRLFADADVETVAWFIEKALAASPYPAPLRPVFTVNDFRPDDLELRLEIELPDNDVVPTVREYRYVKSKDTIQPVPRPSADRKKQYAHITAAVVLRAVHEIFACTSEDIVKSIVVNGRVTTIDRSTGHRERPHLVYLNVNRDIFVQRNLAEVEPAACLNRLHAMVSPNPYDLEAVVPVINFDRSLSRFKFMEDIDVLATLDGRTNLMQLSPSDFEQLVKQLFVAMGAEAWTTIPSKDGGVDAVATSKHVFFGGICLIQAKRWKGLIGLEDVHALTGVMTDHNAHTGALVTTSWFSRASEDFAERNRIRLIDGAQLKHLIKEYLNLDVVPGTTPPRRRTSRTAP